MEIRCAGFILEHSSLEEQAAIRPMLMLYEELLEEDPEELIELWVENFKPEYALPLIDEALRRIKEKSPVKFDMLSSRL